jgi:putative ABC transport system substrate-binding protein
MRRREFIATIFGVAAWTHAARGQQPQKQRRIAFVHSGIPADQLTETAGPFWVRRFFQALRGLGYVEGSNLVVERYSAEGRTDRLTALAATVVNRNPDVIVTNLNALVVAFGTTTTAIPIVAITGDPIGGGLVTSLAHPGGNLTGVSINAGTEIVAKRLQILKEATPSVTKVAYLVSSRGAWDGGLGSSVREAGQRLGIALVGNVLPEVNDAQIRRTFAEIAQQQLDAVIVDEGGSFLAYPALIVELAEKYRLPVIYPYRDYVEIGGLMAYAPDLGELAQRLAEDVHEVIRGTKAGDIPFYQPTKFQLAINLKTAKALGIDIPATLLGRADEVIE